ncbi:MAG: prenyltransferase [Lentisphaerae bacterium]|nr:prenyltransferase [Lentisphaerota bacterium]
MTSRSGTCFAALRAEFLPASILPVLLAAAWVRSRGIVPDMLDLAVIVLGTALAHLGANTMNDYGDHITGSDEANTAPLRPFAGGSRAIQDGRMSPRGVLALSVALLTGAALMAVTLVVRNGAGVLWFGSAALLLGAAYSLPPLRLCSRGLGEAAVAVAFGIIPIAGTEYVLSGRVSFESLVMSLVPAMLIFCVILANEVPDMEADRDSGKSTLVVRFPRGWVAVYSLFSLAWPVPLLLLVSAGSVPGRALVALAAWPLCAGATAAVYRARRTGGRIESSLACGLSIAAHHATVALLAAALVTVRA